MPPRPIHPENTPAARQRRRRARLAAEGGRALHVLLPAEAAAALDRLCAAGECDATEAVLRAILAADAAR